ncbi:putative Guanine deaminase [Thiocapsa sp. KS1]|nr:putative Guanine deaminase [Thiocapsa sp. KS1]
MRRAIALARRGATAGDGGPFGAVIVLGGEIIGEGWNRVIATRDPTAHGEMVAIRDASRRIGNISLQGCVLYTSGQPCPMCRCDLLGADRAGVLRVQHPGCGRHGL